MKYTVLEKLFNQTPSMDDLIRETCLTRSTEDGFYVCDVSEILRKHKQWLINLPRVRPFYAVKCNPSPIVLEILASLGIGFDCASKHEIDSVLERGVSPDDIIYANPCKHQSHIAHAAYRGVNCMTFDNELELFKVKDRNPNAKMVLRIKVDDSHSIFRLGLKFGAQMERVPHLLQTAKDLGVNVVGCSFHVGSGCSDANAYREAIRNARYVIDLGDKLGFDMTLLDIGGGFPGFSTEKITFEGVAAVINESLDKFFPEYDHNGAKSKVNIIAEPGRYYVTSAFTVVCSIIAKRTLILEDKKTVCNNYYITDGVYGSFNCSIFEEYTPTPYVISLDESFKKREYQLSTIWGPTCDSTDCILQNALLPEFHIGEWLVFPNMGAYSVCVSTQFNGFRIPQYIKYYLPSYTIDMLKQLRTWSGICQLIEDSGEHCLEEDDSLLETFSFDYITIH